MYCSAPQLRTSTCASLHYGQFALAKVRLFSETAKIFAGKMKTRTIQSTCSCAFIPPPLYIGGTKEQEMHKERTKNKQRCSNPMQTSRQALLSNPSKPTYIGRFGWIDGNAGKS